MGDWDHDGYLLLPGAAPREAIDAYARDRTELRDGLLVRLPGDEHVSLATQAPDDAPVVDPYAISDAARALLLPPALTSALTDDLFGDAPLLFDAEGAAGGGGASPYRDATNVALAEEPTTLVTALVALGDATVTLYPGSQTITTTPFSGRYRHFNPERDGDEALERHREELTTKLGDPETITLAPGDIIIWHADLVHDAPTGPALVAHLCPARVAPGWFAYRPERARHASYDGGRALITSQHYDLIDALAAPEDPPTEPQDESLRRVEETLREHDDANPQAQQPTPTRRSGGLVDSVRSRLGRRGRR
jgi:hypothetical protein